MPGQSQRNATPKVHERGVSVPSRRIALAIAVVVGGIGILIASLMWASARFDALDAGAPDSPTDILAVGAVAAGLIAVTVGLILLVQGVAAAGSRRRPR